MPEQPFEVKVKNASQNIGREFPFAGKFLKISPQNY